MGYGIVHNSTTRGDKIMLINTVESPFPIFTDVDGSPLESGYVYIGEANQNPEVVPVTVYWDSLLIIPAAQPIRTIGGHPSRSGTAARLYVQGDYSITVRDKNKSLVYNSPVATDIIVSINSLTIMSELIGYTAALDNITVNVLGYHAVNDGGGGLFNWDSTIDKSTADAGTIIDPSVSLANQGTGVGIGCWIRQYSGRINAKWYGAKGNGVDESAILTTLAALGKTVFFPNGTYKGSPLALSSNTKFIGEDIDLTIFDIPTDRNEITIWINNSGCAVENATIHTTMSNIGSGTNGTMVTIGHGTNIEEPLAEVSDTILRNLKGVNLGELCNAITVIGNINGIIIDNVQGDGFAQGIVAHWGSNRNPDLTFIKAYYPHNIYIPNISFSNLANGGLFISACYDVSVGHMHLVDCGQVLSIVAGDSVGAPTSIEDTIMKNIHIEDIYAENVTGEKPITIDGEGHEPTSDDWGRIKFGSVTIDNIYMDCSGTTGGALVIEDADGVNIDSLTVDMSISNSKACDIARSKNITIENLKTNASTSVKVDRSKNITLVNLSAENEKGTATHGIDILGHRYQESLVGAVSIGATSITIASAFPLRVYKGDKIRLLASVDDFAIVTDHYNVGTTINVEATTWAANDGDTVFLDVRTQNLNITDASIDGYEYGISDLISSGFGDITDVLIKNSTIGNSVQDPIQLTRTENLNLAGNKNLKGEPIISTFEPTLAAVTVTLSNRDGKYFVQDGICHFEIEIDYTSLDTADASAIQIGNMPITPKKFGNGNIQLNTYLSTGFNFSATDTLRPVFWDSNSNIVFGNASGTLIAYNSGKIIAAGKILLSGSYYI